MTLPVIAHPDVTNFLRTYSESDLGEGAWKCIHKLKQQQFDGGLRVKRLKGIAKKVWEARVTRAVRLIFTYTQSIEPETREAKTYIAIQDICLDHDDVSRKAKARKKTSDAAWLDAEEIEVIGSLEKDRASLTPEEQSAMKEAEAEDLQIPEEIVDELVGNIQWQVVESESQWQEAITQQNADLPLKLTPEEYELVNYYGNLLLSGNAGTGKTTVGVYRLIKSLETLPEGKRLYVAYNPILVKEAHQHFQRLVGTQITEVESLFEFKTIRNLCLEILEAAGETYLETDEVNYERFNQFYRRSERKKYPPVLVWDEIRSIVKGSSLETDRNLLAKNQYEKLGKKRSSTISTEERPKIHELAEWYQRQLETNGRFDEIDLARQVLKLIKQGIGNRYEMIICDEVQDLTELQLHLLLQLVTSNGHLFFAGDLNQIVSPSGFRWKDLKSEFYRNERPVKEETLRFNFRSVGSLTQLANQLLRLKSRLLNETINELNQTVSNYGEWARLINKPSSNLQPTLKTLYPEDAVLVRTEADKEKLSDEFQSSFVFTIEEAKGLEFDTIFLVEFFQPHSSLWQKAFKGKPALKEKEIPQLRLELNLLYVAITRARRILNIWEDQISTIWTQEEVQNFTQEISPESVREVRVKPTPEMWKERGFYYLEAKFYRQAIECFQYSRDTKLQKQTEAKLLLQEGKESEAIEIFIAIKEHKQVAHLFEKQKQWDKAAEQYNLAGFSGKSTECRTQNSPKKLHSVDINQEEKFLAPNLQVYQNSSMTLVGTLQTLTQDEDFEIRQRIASNQNLPMTLLQQLSRDEDFEVRKAVASNTNTPVEVLQQLAQDKNWVIREQVASNSKTPVGTLQTLTQDKDFRIRQRIASNQNLPMTLLQQLSRDEDFEVRQRIASNQNLPMTLLQQLSRDENLNVRKAVASNPSVPIKFLEKLARERNWEVREGVASNPNTPVQILQHLAQYEEYVSQKVTSSPVALLQRLLAMIMGEYVKPRGVAFNTNTPVELLQQLAQDQSVLVRKGVASNTNTPVELLQQLARDQGLLVRQKAKEMLKKGVSKGVSKGTARRRGRGR